MVGRLKSGALMAALAASVAVVAPSVATAQINWGNEGEPVNLVIGFQPYYSQSWSGLVMREKEFWREYLPEGSQVRFEVGLQGAVIVNAMTGEQMHIGYAGDTPSIAATFRNMPERGRTDIRIIANLGTSTQHCNVFFVRNDAPEFAGADEAVAWMDDKVVSTPHGTCTDRFAQDVFQQADIEPSSYLNQNIEVITSNFRVGNLDAGVIWEPTATKLELEGIARRVASGEDFDVFDGGFLIVLNSLLEQRPDIIRGWLEAELDAQLFMLDPENANEIAAMAVAATEGFTHEEMWMSFFGEYPAEVGGGEVRNVHNFVFTDEVQNLLSDATEFLYNTPQRPAAEPQIREEALDDSIARQVLEDRGLEAPIGVIRAIPRDQYNYDG